ncbi:restriction endonuclease [Halomonas sp. ISL-60]|uniref:restriction endonuclease n=1 Tax=Halomonas sp. ISL-56 TaxID=2819149 RepID=UPI001BE662CB|nr:restriction endonuclease [Halomonas sp. ISL-56]MBT2772124.1 restriction endonuclease [Halomonas sp. ISL-60]MBT2800805.1 restriction endonuclease [Halomonas sp. ISL-56]
MASNWKEYQEEVAEFFRSLGCNTQIEKKVDGARGTHSVDVWVTFNVLGIDANWLIECKYWKNAVPKEKVLALSQIAQDVGADRAFLLSESGFQAGAVRMATSTNITLTNLEELRTHAKPDMLDRAMNALAKKAHNLQNQLHDILILDNNSPGPWPGADREEVIEILAEVFEVKTIVLPKALSGEFPVLIDLGREKALGAEQLVTEISNKLEKIEKRLNEIDAEVASTRSEAQKTTVSLLEEVSKLLVFGEKALFGPFTSENDFEEFRLAALEAMKRVGAISKQARSIVAGHISSDLHALTRSLIDGVYLDLSQPKVDRQQWNESARAAIEALDRLSKSIA